MLWRCPECGHVRRDLALCSAQARAHAWGGDRTLDAARLRLAYHRIRHLLPDVLQPSVFEVGFGSGELLRKFLDAGCDVAGVEPDALEIPVDSHVRAAGRLVCGELENIRTGRFTCDLVYGIHVLEHLRDPAAALQRCREILRPGGHVYFLTPTAGSAGLNMFGSAWWLLEDPTHLRFFSAGSLHRLLTVAGFTDVRVRSLLLDNLSMETCSLLRRIFPRSSQHGVLSRPGTRTLSLVAAAPTVVARCLWPALRPTLEVTARRR